MQTSHHVLVVEPDDSIRALLTAVLRRHQYQTTIVSSRTEAMRALDDGPFCLAIVDCIPGEVCVIKDIAAAHPDLPIAITATIPSKLEELPPSVVQVLHKPYDIGVIDALTHAHCSPDNTHSRSN